MLVVAWKRCTVATMVGFISPAGIASRNGHLAARSLLESRINDNAYYWRRTGTNSTLLDFFVHSVLFLLFGLKETVRGVQKSLQISRSK